MLICWFSFYSVFLMRDVLFVHAEEGWNYDCTKEG
jgi:hypothetical protein